MTRKEIEMNQNLPWFAGGRNTAMLILALFLVLLGGSFFLCYLHDQSTTEQILKEDRATAGLLALILDEHVLSITMTMESYTRRPLLIKAVRENNLAKTTAHLIDLSSNNPNIESMIVTDREGTAWIVHPHHPDILGRNFSYRDWYQGVSRQWKPYISNAALRTTADKDTTILIAVPIFDTDGIVIGILVNSQRAVTLGKLLHRATMDADAFVSVTDRKGILIYSSRYAYEKKLAAYPFYSLFKDVHQDRPQTVFVVNASAGDATYYVSSAGIAGIGWRVFVGRDRQSILLASSVYFIQTAAMSILLFLTIALLLLYINKHTQVQMTENTLAAQKELLTAQTRFRDLFDHMSSGVAIYDAVSKGEDFVISNMNAAARRITGIHENYCGKSVREVFPGVVEFGLFQIFQQVWHTGVAAPYPTAIYQDQRLAFWVENYVYKLPSGQIVAIFDDVTARKHAEEQVIRQTKLLFAINRLFSETIRTDSSEAVAQVCLTVAQDVTGSPIGFIAELNPDGLFSTTALTNLGWDLCRIPETKATTMIQNMTIRGLWGQVLLKQRSLIVNDPSVFSDRVGLPEGHPLITSFLGVPLMDQGKVIGMIALANRPQGYSDEQRENIEALAVAFVESLRRNQAEEKIKRMNEELEKRVAERTAELERLNRVFVDRELRMRELKARIAEWEKK